jgi:hypothetical protein
MLKPAYDAVHDKANREDDATDVHVVYGLHTLYILLTGSEQMHRRRILLFYPSPRLFPLPSVSLASKNITQISSLC